VFSDSSADEVAVLSSKVQNENGVVFCLHFVAQELLGFAV